MPDISFIEQLAQQSAQGAAGGIMGIALAGINDKRQLKQQGKLNEQQFQIDNKMAEMNYARQLRLWEDTNYKAQVQQLEKAGLNPGLLYGMGGGGGATANAQTGNVNAGKAPTGGGEIIGMMDTKMRLELLKAQKENIEADTANKQAEIPVKGATVPKLQAETADLLQGIENKKAQQKLTEIQTKIGKIDEQLKSETLEDSAYIVKFEAKKLQQEIVQLALDNNLNQQQLNDKVTMLKAELAGQWLKNALTKSETNNINQDTKNKIQQLINDKIKWKQLIQELWIGRESNSRENSLLKLKQQIQWDENTQDDNAIGDLIQKLVPIIGIPLGGGRSHTPIKGFHK